LKDRCSQKRKCKRAANFIVSYGNPAKFCSWSLKTVLLFK